MDLFIITISGMERGGGQIQVKSAMNIYNVILVARKTQGHMMKSPRMGLNMYIKTTKQELVGLNMKASTVDRNIGLS